MTIFSRLAGRLLPAALFALGLGIAQARAAEPVVVSTPPLHSLASILLEGVAEPGLLFRSEADMKRPVLSTDGYERVRGARLVIWNGQAYERALAGAFSSDRDSARKALTVSDTMPLFTLPDANVQDRPGTSRDMRFWLDPKLALMAVRRLAPALVTVYPDASNRILDNEIVLKKRLKKMEKSMRAMLESKPGVPLHVPQSDVTYLAWRFNLTTHSCKAAAQLQDGFRTIAGLKQYFTMMGEIETALARCQGVGGKTS